MASWSDLLDHVQQSTSIDGIRRQALADLSAYRGRNLICYYSGWLLRPAISEVAVSDNDTNGFMNAICGMERSKGLDLMLHTPGGDLAATEAIVEYLGDFFKGDVCAIVPQLAMSAGTMIACSCREIIMGRQSSLGPTDPQLNGVAAGAVVEEFERAVAQVSENPASAAIWSQIICQYPPTFLGDCQRVVDMSTNMVGSWLRGNMFQGDPDCDAAVERILGLLCDHSQSAMHNRHFAHEELEKLGLKVRLMEEDNDLQDKILTLHHLYMITFQQTPAVKIIEGSTGKSWILNGS